MEDVYERKCKKYVFNFITLIIAIFSLLSLLIPLLDVQIELNIFDKISNNTSINGFDFITNFSSAINQSWIYKFASIVCLLQLVFSILLILGNLFISILFDEEKVKKISIISIIICMVFAILFLLVGIFLVSEIKSSVGNEFSKPDYTNMYGSVKILTLSYIPIIIQVVLIFALFMFNAISKTDIFNKPKKTNYSNTNNNSNNNLTQVSTAKLLVEYKELYDNGVITQAEYLSLRSKLLNK